MSKLSVLLPVYNGVDNYPPGMLLASINSILRLDVDCELIIIDDGSIDDIDSFWEELPYLAYISPYLTDDIEKRPPIERVRFIKLENNQGQAAALNKGLEVATGDYIWQWSVRAQAYREAVALIELLDNNPDVGFVYGAMRSYGGEKEYIHRPPHIFDRQRFIERYLCNFYIYRRMEGLRYVEQVKLHGRAVGICDRDMVMQLIDKGAVGMGLHDVLCVSYYNGGRHKYQEQPYRDMIERLFNTRWEHIKT